MALTPDDVADIHPRGSLVLIDPFRPDGFYAGLYLEYRKSLYPVLGRVLRVGPKCEGRVKVNDVVVFRPLNYTDAELEDGRAFSFIEERACSAVIGGYDDFSLAS